MIRQPPQKTEQPGSSSDSTQDSTSLVVVHGPMAHPEAHPGQGRNRVLVIDDYENYRATLSDVLADAGYAVTAAANGVAGLAEVCASHPDLIILDFNMPGLNGFEVIKDLRSREDTRNIPIVMLTGETNTDRMGDANLDIEEMLRKPVSSADILSAVKRILPSAVTQSAESSGRPARVPADTDLKDLVEQQPMPLASLLDLETEPVEEEIGLELAANDSPIVARINSILVHAVERRASDIHIEPREGSLQVRLRVQGILETAEIAAKASLTGHLVLSTLHTNSAPATAARLTHMGLPPYLVAGSLRLVVAQRLIRVLCPKCRTPGAPTADERKLFSKDASQRLSRVWRKVGCQECGRTGYVGRRSLFEVMPVQTQEMRRLILKGADSEALSGQAMAEGMTTLSEAALACLESGETSLDEGLRILLSE